LKRVDDQHRRESETTAAAALRERILLKCHKELMDSVGSEVSWIEGRDGDERELRMLAREAAYLRDKGWIRASIASSEDIVEAQLTTAGRDYVEEHLLPRRSRDGDGDA
jgi:hypothetical protein